MKAVSHIVYKGWVAMFFLFCFVFPPVAFLPVEILWNDLGHFFLTAYPPNDWLSYLVSSNIFFFPLTQPEPACIAYTENFKT